MASVVRRQNSAWESYSTATGWSVVALALWAIHRPGLAVDPTRVPEFGYFVALLAGGAMTGAGWWPIRTGER